MLTIITALKPPDASAIISPNGWAIFVAAIVIYAIGFVIYGVVFQKIWLQQTGYTQEQLKPHMWKMGISWIMPVLTAFGVAWAISLARVDNLAAVLAICAQLWIFLILPTRLYSYVYGPERPGHLALDAIHLLLGVLAAGTVIAIWP